MAEHTMSDQTDVMHEQHAHAEPARENQGEDSFADALAAVALIAIFVFTCIYWISGQ